MILLLICAYPNIKFNRDFPGFEQDVERRGLGKPSSGIREKMSDRFARSRGVPQPPMMPVVHWRRPFYRSLSSNSLACLALCRRYLLQFRSVARRIPNTINTPPIARAIQALHRS